MDQKPSILDKIIDSQHEYSASLQDCINAVSQLLGQLSQRDRAILTRRFALSGAQPETLKEIGESLNITRERVRQIEHTALADLKRHFRSEGGELARNIERTVRILLEENGGSLTHDRLLRKVVELGGTYDGTTDEQQINHHTYTLLFLLEHLFVDIFHPIEETREFNRGWRLPSHDWNKTQIVINQAHQVFEEHGKPLKENDFFIKLSGHFPEELETILKERVAFTKRIRSNVFGQWGLVQWKEIVPKRMNDKIHLVLRHHGKPLHFTEIAQHINDVKFDKKIAHPSTIHNELIFDKKYVLVGRGIYALSEWGYNRGVVADVIKNVMREAGEALSRDAVVDRVLQQRIVRKSTIHLALTDRTQFKRLEDGRYAIEEVGVVPVDLEEGKSEVLPTVSE